MKQPTVLEITRLDASRYGLRMMRPDEPFVGATVQVWEVSVQPQLIDGVRQMISGAIRRPGTAMEPLKAAGEGLYAALLPVHGYRVDELRKALKAVRTPLLISTNEPDVVWELLNDGEGEGFFSLKFDVGRTLMTRHVPFAPPKPGRSWRCLLIADPNQDEPAWALPDAAVEAEALRRWFESRNIECDYLEGPEADFAGVLKHLLEHSYDIIHYAGHVVQDEVSREYAFRLLGAQLLTAGSLRVLVKPSPIVFLNACWAGKAQGMANSGESVQGLTDAFLGAGALAVLGSLSEVPDRGARAFAERFYELVLGGKALGEAVRLARKHTMTNPEYGAAWACFVLYGNPCLQIELKHDELEAMLQEAEEGKRLSRTDFEASGIEVIERAFEYALPTGELSTAHLFAAMVGGVLRDRLQALGIPAEKLREAFQEVFRQVHDALAEPESGGEEPRKTNLSANTRAILLDAKKASKGAISAIHVVRSFIQHKGGSVGLILRQMGVRIEDLDPEGKPPGHKGRREREENPPEPTERSHEQAPEEKPAERKPPAPAKRVGPLQPQDCTPEAWQVMSAAAELAENGQIGTPQLFIGLLRNPEGALARALRRVGLAAALPAGAAGAPVEEAGCSQNTGQILLLAQATAAAESRPIGEDDLVAAFIEYGGGAMGSWFESRGLVLTALTSSLFQEGGRLDLSRFDEPGQKVLEEMFELARSKRHGVVGRTHLLYSMLSAPNSVLAERLAEQQVDAEQLADLLYVRFPQGSASPMEIEERLTAMSPGLTRILCRAESEARGRDSEAIGERDLLAAFVKDGGGSAGEFLTRSGVRRSKLI